MTAFVVGALIALVVLLAVLFCAPLIEKFHKPLPAPRPTDPPVRAVLTDIDGKVWCTELAQPTRCVVVPGLVPDEVKFFHEDDPITPEPVTFVERRFTLHEVHYREEKEVGRR